MPLKDEVVGNVQSVPLGFLLASTILVLLVACANVANLLVVRVEGRHHEFAIRYAYRRKRGKEFPPIFSSRAACLGLREA